jgi:hypothetical protein
VVTFEKFRIGHDKHVHFLRFHGGLRCLLNEMWAAERSP